MRRGIQVLSILFVWLALAASAYADKRVALVIGNGGYQAVPRLSNPTKDAAAISAALERLGFTVRTETDVGFDAMRRALKDFAGVSAGADLAVIFYAGHGMEIGGENYLVPIDAKLTSDVDVPYEAISLNLALGAVEGARGTRLIILDACRNNPFLATIQVGAKSRSIGRGLARVEPDFGTLVAYAAREGTTADDGDSEHSPYTKALLQHIEEPGIDVDFLLREVRDTVREATNGSQVPFTYGSLPGKVVLLSPVKEPALPPPAPPPPAVSDSGNEIAAEVAFWNSVGDSGDRRLLESYLTQYPNGRFAGLAKILIARLNSEAAKPPPAPAAASAGPPAAPPPVVAGETPAGDAAKDKPAAAASPPGAAVASTDGGAAGNASPAKLPAIAPGGPTPTVDSGAAADKAGTGGSSRGSSQAGAPGDAGGAPAIGPLAALPPPSAPVAEATLNPDLVRNVQKELVRVGCAAGSVDGVWGKKGRSAVEAFARYSKISLASLDPSEDLLSTLQGYGGRACPLSCGVRYEAKGDSCVLKTCPKGTSLNGGGSCAAMPPPLQPKQAAPAGGKKATASASGGGCVKETPLQCQGRMESDSSARNAHAFGSGPDSFVRIQIYCDSPSNRVCH